MTFISRSVRILKDHLPDDFDDLTNQPTKMRQFKPNMDLRSWSCNSFKRHEHLIELVTEKGNCCENKEYVAEQERGFKENEPYENAQQELSCGGEINSITFRKEKPRENENEITYKNMLDRIATLIIDDNENLHDMNETIVSVERHINNEKTIEIKVEAKRPSFIQYTFEELEEKIIKLRDKASADDESHTISELLRQLNEINEENFVLRQKLRSLLIPKERLHVNMQEGKPQIKDKYILCDCGGYRVRR